VAVEPLTGAEMAELEESVRDFVSDMALVGIQCVVILEGRGADRLAYPGHLISEAPTMLERGLMSARKRQARIMN
jgi:hypothetical protein